MLLLYIIIFTAISGVAGVIGSAFIIFKLSKSEGTIQHFVTFAAGVMFAAAFFDLIPEAIEGHGNVNTVMGFVLVGIIIVYLLEKLLLWPHCHGEVCSSHNVAAPLIMAGDTLHNFLDGVAISAAFLVSIPLGIATTTAVFFHELPQEMGDVGALLYLGYTKKKVMIFNIISALAGVVGAIIVYFVGVNKGFNPAIFLAITAGGFIYIAGADLLPEVHHGLNRHNLITHTLIFVGGIALFWFVGILISSH